MARSLPIRLLASKPFPPASPPFTNNSTFRVMQMHLTETPQSPRRSRPGIPPELDQMLMKAIEKNQTRRYQSVREMSGVGIIHWLPYSRMLVTFFGHWSTVPAE